MLNFTYEDINNRDLTEALEKIDNAPAQKLSSKTLFDFNKIKGRWDREAIRCRRSYGELVNKHAEMVPVLDADEKPVMGPDGKPASKPKTGPGGPMDIVWKDVDAWVADRDQLFARGWELKCSRLPHTELVDCGLTPKQIRACEKIMEEPK